MHARALIRCDASPSIGFGHLVRCLALAETLRQGSDCELQFLLRPDPAAETLISKQGFTYHQLRATTSTAYQEAILTLHAARPFSLFIGDVRDGLPPRAILALKKLGVLTVAIDEPSDYRLMVDLVFYPPIPQVKTMNWQGFSGKIFAGWEYVILRREYAAHLYPSYEQRAPQQLLVSCGASDPAQMTVAIVRALQKITALPPVTVLLGPAAHSGEELRALLQGDERFTCIEGASSLAPLLCHTRLGIVSFGVTAYECAALAVPAIHYSLSPDHLLSAGVFSREGMAKNLGLFADFEPSRLRTTVEELLASPQLLLHMAKACRVIPGNSLQLIAETILSALPRLR